MKTLTQPQRDLINKFVVDAWEAFKECGVQEIVVTIGSDRQSVQIKHEIWPPMRAKEVETPK